jgi:hypothetical protein
MIAVKVQVARTGQGAITTGPGDRDALSAADAAQGKSKDM